MTSQSRYGCEESGILVCDPPVIMRKSKTNDERYMNFCITDTIRYEVTHWLYTETTRYVIHGRTIISYAPITWRRNHGSWLK